ncbi:MAG: CYTH domain-containing protein [Candidatus Dormibacteraeota bacterium]|nr:CYTH domain-containing protein [Candidatus Dormibacteraeota bacterium]MBV9525161.1 CYTH domain-containing protein [Candidatus Dormibacteraeota bacterium]
MPLEREVKLDVSWDYVLPRLDGINGLRSVDRGVRVLDATYWDTADLELLHAGAGLRHRTTDGARGTWTLKGESARSGDALLREETEVAGAPEHPPAEVLRHLPERLRSARLQPVAVLRTHRHVIDLVDDDDGRWAEVADDRVEVLEGGAVVSAFREVEVEVAGEGFEQRLQLVVAALRAAGAEAPAVMAKYVRALQALGRVR